MADLVNPILTWNVLLLKGDDDQKGCDVKSEMEKAKKKNLQEKGKSCKTATSK